MSDYYEGQHVYGVSGLLFLYFFFAIFVWAWAGTWGYTGFAGIDLFVIVLVLSAISSRFFRTLQIGFVGRDRMKWLMVGFMGLTVIMLGFQFSTMMTIYGQEIMLSGMMAAVTEEVFARGFLYPMMMRATKNFFLAAFISSFTWAILHHVAYAGDPMMIAYFIVAGFVLAAVMEKAQSLDVPILIHLLTNVLASLPYLGVI